MAIYIYSVVVSLIIFVGCTKGEELTPTSSVEGYDTRSINFVSQSSRALSNDIGTMEGDADGFVVYGVESGDSSWYEGIDGSRYIYDSSTGMWGWESEDDPLWSDPFRQINFYAYYPHSATGLTLSTLAPSTLVGDIVVEPSILDQTDYLAASSGDVVTKPLTGVQSLNFNHIMAKISFSVVQDEGVLTLIRQLGIENVINKGSYDYIASAWGDLSNGNRGSFDDYVGSSGPFAKYGVADKVDPIRSDYHYLMLIPQEGGNGESQTPLWDGSVIVDGSGEFVPEGGYISLRYRTSANVDTEDLIGCAIREGSPNETEWAEGSDYYNAYKRSGGSYTGPLYVKVGFKFSADQLCWEAGTEYNYTLPLNKTGGIYLSEYYCDVDGTNTKIRVAGSPEVGDLVFASDVTIGVTVNGWSYSGSDIYIL